MPNASVQRLLTGRVLRWITLALVMITVSGPASASGAGEASTEPPATQEANHSLPSEKQTTLGLYVTAREAYEKWRAAPVKPIILDVRTPEQFMFVGHAEMAWNIPVAAQSYEWDAETRQFPMRLRSSKAPSGGLNEPMMRSLAVAGGSTVIGSLSRRCLWLSLTSDTGRVRLCRDNSEPILGEVSSGTEGVKRRF